MNTESNQPAEMQKPAEQSTPLSQLEANKETIKALQDEYKNFNEQKKLYDLVCGTIYNGAIHPDLLPLFANARTLANAERLGGNESYFKLMRIDSFEGLTFNEMGHVFNFIETLSAKDCQSVGIDSAVFLDVFEYTHKESAIGSWNKQVDVWKEEISLEKEAIAKKANELVNFLNNKLKHKSRKERKEDSGLKVAHKK